MKICIKCNQAKAEDQFYANSGTNDGREGSCKECRKAIIREHYRSKYHRDPLFRSSELVRSRKKDRLRCKIKSWNALFEKAFREYAAGRALDKIYSKKD